jgi:hypothetical protein
LEIILIAIPIIILGVSVLIIFSGSGGSSKKPSDKRPNDDHAKKGGYGSHSHKADTIPGHHRATDAYTKLGVSVSAQSQKPNRRHILN